MPGAVILNEPRENFTLKNTFVLKEGVLMDALFI